MKYADSLRYWLNLHKRSGYLKETSQEKHIMLSKSLVQEYVPQCYNCRTFCELGVGSGRNLYYFHEAHPEWQYVGNDIAPNLFSDIKKMYPQVLGWARVEKADTLSFLKKNPEMDITFTQGHLMHIPDDAIIQVCALMAEKTRRYMLLSQEAFSTDREVGLFQRLKYRRYRFGRDYESLFPGFTLLEKKVYSHETKKGVRYGRYFFKKNGAL